MEPIASLAARLALEPHPEGGFYRRWYTSAAALPAAAAGAGAPPPRACASSILFALPRGGTSSLHRLGSEELWLYQGGCALTVVQLAADGGVREARVLPGEPLAVPAGVLFGAYVDAAEEGEAYALVSCVVVPAFEWREFEMPDKAALLAAYAGNAQAEAAIQRLCR